MKYISVELWCRWTRMSFFPIIKLRTAQDETCSWLRKQATVVWEIHLRQQPFTQVLLPFVPITYLELTEFFARFSWINITNKSCGLKLPSWGLGPQPYHQWCCSSIFFFHMLIRMVSRALEAWKQVQTSHSIYCTSFRKLYCTVHGQTLNKGVCQINDFKNLQELLRRLREGWRHGS
jgi:hypothetical protein